MKKRITDEIENFSHKKLHVKSKKLNEISLLSGPYSSINLMKNDYIQLKNFGFEELRYLLMNKLKIFLLFLFINFQTQILANPSINARTAIVVDYHSDKVLYELDPDAQIYPASMTKIMTSIIAFDLINKNRLSLDDKFVVSENA